MPLPHHFAIRALKLYRRIVKLHLRKLPSQMRGIGDLYVKKEFRQHLDDASDEQFHTFYLAWDKYAAELESIPLTKKEFYPDTLKQSKLVEKLSSDQKEALEGLHSVIKEDKID